MSVQFIVPTLFFIISLSFASGQGCSSSQTIFTVGAGSGNSSTTTACTVYSPGGVTTIGILSPNTAFKSFPIDCFTASQPAVITIGASECPYVIFYSAKPAQGGQTFTVSLTAYLENSQSQTYHANVSVSADNISYYYCNTSSMTGLRSTTTSTVSCRVPFDMNKIYLKIFNDANGSKQRMQGVTLTVTNCTLPPSPSTSPSGTPSTTPSVSASPSSTPSISASPSVTPSISVSPSVTPSVSVSPSVTPSISVSPSITPSISPSSSITPSISPSASVSSSKVPPSASSSFVPSSSPSASSSPPFSFPSMTPAPSFPSFPSMSSFPTFPPMSAAPSSDPGDSSAASFEVTYVLVAVLVFLLV